MTPIKFHVPKYELMTEPKSFHVAEMHFMTPKFFHVTERHFMTPKKAFHVAENDFMSPRKSTFRMDYSGFIPINKQTNKPTDIQTNKQRKHPK